MNQVRGKGTVTESENRESRIENRGLGISNPQSPIRTPQSTIHISLLTGGADRPYALGLAAALTSAGLSVDFIGSDDLNLPELRNNRLVNFLNLRGDQNPGANPTRKVARILTYYWRLTRYAATAKPKIFHILWNNKFELFDRTLLMLYYNLLGKRGGALGSATITKRSCFSAKLRPIRGSIIWSTLSRIWRSEMKVIAW
jgi:hypothetical protein